ncbi:ubiquinol oxidase subunit II [Acetobacteraceae bacterium]|nr:ubiquinol oxidase subunit II [Candidatus Parcubacteria bacterium]
MGVLTLFPLLTPSGAVGLAERALMMHVVLFMLIVTIPVYFLLFFFAWRYRDRKVGAIANTKGGRVAYFPNWESGKMEELVWWAIPFEIVLILGALTWSSTHALAPEKPLEGGTPLVIEVVALEWKWLFIYPEENIATVNYLAVPVDRPVEFRVTADAPMNSFWIPQLGGQIYAMTGMTTSLHLIANEEGVFAGGSANYSGDGFSKMKFMTHAISEEDFSAWVQEIRTSPIVLSFNAYKMLAEPTVESEPTYYGRVENNLYNTIVMQFAHAMNGGFQEGKTGGRFPERALQTFHE